MPIKDGREYRSFIPMKPLQEKGGYIVEGYAATWEPYDMGNGIKEHILRSALDNADMSDVIFQMNHEGSPLARIRNNTLSIELDAHGMLVRADLGGSQAGRDLYEGITNGLIDRMSWGFTVAADGWEWDETTHTSTVTKVLKVFDVSAVSIPANEGTEIHARSYLDGVIEGKHKEFVQRKKKERERISAFLDLV